MLPVHRPRLPILADKGYIGAGIGVHVPIRRPAGGQALAADTRTRNLALCALRGVAERGNALLKTRWRTLQHVTLDPRRISAITAAALVLTSLERGRY